MRPAASVGQERHMFRRMSWKMGLQACLQETSKTGPQGSEDSHWQGGPSKCFLLVQRGPW